LSTLPWIAIVADDTPATIELVTRWLDPLGFTVIGADTSDAALAAALDHKRVLLLAPAALPGLEKLIHRLHTEVNCVQIVVTTPRTAADAAAATVDAGADDLLLEPFLPLELRIRLRRAVHVLELEDQRDELEGQGQMLTEILAAAKIHSRQFLNPQLEKELTRARRFSHAVALILIDIASSHADKNTVRRLGLRLTELLRAQLDWVAAYGEHTLAVVLPETTTRGALKAAQRLRAALAGTALEGAGLPQSLRVNFGFSAVDLAPSVTLPDADRLIRSAEGYLTSAARSRVDRIAGGPALPSRSH